ncbi:MAG: hypothetical protein IK016_11760 [Lachnospiraceae bacterium]|nr:hypothetical protein [Lachnospiraceae bacterium]
MDQNFPDREKLFRAVYPPSHPGMFWKRDGSLSSAAFADPKGLSVNRGGDRTDAESVEIMRQTFQGCIVSLRAGDCKEADAIVKYLPTKANAYHSEIHQSEQVILLSKMQRLHLSKRAVIEYMA